MYMHTSPKALIYCQVKKFLRFVMDVLRNIRFSVRNFKNMAT